MFIALTGLLLGLALGVRHAFEPDHLAAVSTLMVDGRGGARGALLGAFWGVGHTVSLLLVGLVLALLGAQLPERLADLFELGVAFMLLGLGARALWRALRLGSEGEQRPHLHGKDQHLHAGQSDHLHLWRWTLARRPLLVGLVHGLAGSGALTALAFATLPTLPARLLYIALFGLGSIAGMSLLSGLAGLPLSRLGRSPRFLRALTATTGAVSTVLGLVWGYPIAGRLLSLQGLGS